VATAIVALASCARSSPVVAVGWPPALQPLASPASANTSLPRLIATDAGVILSWVERAGPKTTLKFAERTTSTWGAPITVASGNDWFVSYADPPSVLRLSSGTLVAQWEQQTDPRIEAMDLRMSYSTDGGRTWVPSFTPHHDGTMTQHAFPSLFELPGHALGLVWLDGRESLIETEDPAGGAMTMRYAAFDASWKQTADLAVDHRVCECCSTAAAVTPDGVLTAFRDRSAGEIRNIAVARLEKGAWTAATTVHDDGWKTHSCPVNGPALTTRDRNAAVAWFTAVNDQGHSYAAFSSDAGRSWGNPIRLDETASLGRVDIEMLDDGSAAAMWVEYADRRAQVRMRRVGGGAPSSPAIPVAGVADSTASGFPQLTRFRNQLVIAWTENAPAPEGAEAPQKVLTAIAAMP
jgi:hypothetical protein